MQVLKASGERDLYDREKLMQSLTRSGASPETAHRVADEVEVELRDGMSTRKIYRRAFQYLRRHSIHAASQYKLKQAVMQLGPSGYPFERFIGEILKMKGYDVRVGQMLDGRCVRHEVDVVAVRGHEMILTECKFRNQPGSKTDVKVALYYHSRFNDLLDAIKVNEKAFYNRLGFAYPGGGKSEAMQYKGWIVTNAKFTDDAIQYARCTGLHLVGWDFPEKSGLIGFIRETGLLPVTILQSLSGANAARVLAEGVVVCRELRENHEVLDKVGVDKTNKRRIMTELEAVLG
jgi:hypothetical protein